MRHGVLPFALAMPCDTTLQRFRMRLHVVSSQSSYSSFVILLAQLRSAFGFSLSSSFLLSYSNFKACVTEDLVKLKLSCNEWSFASKL